jgi:hypothetical protein
MPDDEGARSCRRCAWWTPLSALEEPRSHLPAGWGRCVYAVEATRGYFGRSGPGYVVDRQGAWHPGSPHADYGLPLTAMMVFQQFGEQGTALLTAPHFGCQGFVARAPRGA